MGIIVSENGVGDDQATEGQEEPETDMTDPENYGSLTIEDPDGDEDPEGRSSDPSTPDG